MMKAAMFVGIVAQVTKPGGPAPEPGCGTN
jgi:hypothetical protein